MFDDVPIAPADDMPSRAFLERAVARSNANALRMALFELTGAPELAAMRVESRAVRGGAMEVSTLSKADRTRVTELALAYLQAPRSAPPPAPDRERAAYLLELFGSVVDSPSALNLALDEFGIPATNRNDAPPPEDLLRHRVTIIGAGVSGIALAIRLQRLGLPFEIIERQDGVGGTWCLNDYPEARVDISNFIYQFRFEPNYPWTSLFAPQAEIRAYLEHIVTKYGLRPHIRLGESVQTARWDEAQRRWELRTVQADGVERTLTTNFLVSAAGLFSTPNMPDLPGLETFSGPVMHTTTWDHGYDFAGKRVALVGNGSSGAQVMPWLARTAETLTVFQRTPNWMSPIEQYRNEVTPEQQWLFNNVPGYWRWYCYAMLSLDKQVEDLQLEDRAWIDHGGGFNARNDLYRQFLADHIREQLAGRPDLIAQSIPHYPPLARRLVVDNGWFTALRQPNVALVSDGIARVEPDAIVSGDGRRHEIDVIVLGTGFRASDFLCSVDYEGRNGARLSDLWAVDGARAHLGLFVPDLPNFFIFYGPNGQPQSGSFHDWADRCARVAIDLITETIARGATTFEVSRETYDSYNRRLDDRMARMIWGREGSGGYYINDHGRPITKMPWRGHEYFDQLMTRPDGAFDFT